MSHEKLTLATVLAALALLAGLALYRTGGERQAVPQAASGRDERPTPGAGAGPSSHGARQPQGGKAVVPLPAQSASATEQPFNVQRTLAVNEWRHRVQPEIDRCLPVPRADAAPHPVQVVFEWQGEISGPTLQRFAVSTVTPIGVAKAPPEVRACLERLRGTTVNVEATEDALVAGESRFTDRLDLRWANGEG